MDSEAPWLTEAQQQAWRGWLAVNARLPVALNRQLQSDSGLSLQDFDVLVHVTETEGGRARVSDLAHTLQWERSRLSHHVKRMEGRGLVVREECADDGRGAFVVITFAGRAVIERAAPDHARTVRDLVFEALTDDDLAHLVTITDKVLDRLGAGS